MVFKHKNGLEEKYKEYKELIEGEYSNVKAVQALINETDSLLPKIYKEFGSSQIQKAHEIHCLIFYLQIFLTTKDCCFPLLIELPMGNNSPDFIIKTPFRHYIGEVTAPYINKNGLDRSLENRIRAIEENINPYYTFRTSLLNPTNLNNFLSKHKGREKDIETILIMANIYRHIENENDEEIRKKQEEAVKKLSRKIDKDNLKCIIHVHLNDPYFPEACRVLLMELSVVTDNDDHKGSYEALETAIKEKALKSSNYQWNKEDIPYKKILIIKNNFFLPQGDLEVFFWSLEKTFLSLLNSEKLSNHDFSSIYIMESLGSYTKPYLEMNLEKGGWEVRYKSRVTYQG